MADTGTSVKDASLFNSHLLPGNDDMEILAHIDDLFDRCRKNRIQFEQQWYLNLAFYFGRQNVQWIGSGLASANFSARLYEPPAPPWRVRLIINKIRTIVRTELAKVTKEQPRAFITPASSDDDDLAAARAGEAIYEYLYRTLEMKKLVRRAEFWSVICGTGFIKDWIDPSMPDESGQIGKLQVEPISPFHIYVPDTQEEDLEKQPFIIHVGAKDPDWVKATYDVEIAPDSTASSSQLEQKFLQSLGINERPNPSYVSVKEIWIKPCAKFESGAVITWAGEQILAKSVDGWPFQHNQYPFTKLDAIPTGRFYSDSIVTDLIPLQKEYNRTRSQIVEAKNRMSKPQLMAPRGSVDPSKITTEPGLIIFYTPGFDKPTPVPLQNIPSYVLQEVERIQGDMNDLSSQHEVSKGQTPPGVTAATAISYLQEADDTKLSYAVASLEEGVERIGRHLLSNVQQFWDGTRTITVVGTDNQWESSEFSRADLRGNTALSVESGSAMPVSRAAKQAFIMDLGQRGYIPPDRVLRYLDMAETGRLYEEMQLDARQAQRENLRMAEQDPNVTVNTWDNHMVHITEHNNYRKKQAFENLDPNSKAMFEQHVNNHKQLAAQEQGGMISPTSPLPGGNPQKPGVPGTPPSSMATGPGNQGLNNGGNPIGGQ